MRVLFVTNGHGEVAIARRIAGEMRRLDPATATDHFALVGSGFGARDFPDVGPQRAMPSGGLVAMGNAVAFGRDLAAGFVPLWFAQRRFLRGARARYDAVVAVGDAYGLLMARTAKLPAFFVGTAKSVYVARYGPFERRILRGAKRVFVRDEPTASALRGAGLAAEAPGNVIVDLAQSERRFPWSGRAESRIAILPGSRAAAYDAALRLSAVLARAVRAAGPGPEAGLSLAPGIDAGEMRRRLAAAGWRIEDGEGDIPFVAHRDGVRLAAWSGELGALLAGATLAFGQAGTANEAAAARGIPVAALAEPQGENWYRMRQRRLLGEALAILPPGEIDAAAALRELLDDGGRRAAMARSGRERMGGPGGAAAIAAAILGHAR